MAVDVHISLDGDDEVEAGLGDASGSQHHSGGEGVAVHCEVAPTPRLVSDPLVP